MKIVFARLLDAGPKWLLLGVCLGTLPACGQILGVEDEPILVGRRCEGTLRVRITTDETGTATDIAPPYNYGVYDYLRYLNDTEGGLRGCLIDVQMEDAGYDSAKTAEVVAAWRKEPTWAEVSTLFIFGTGPTTLIAPDVMKEKKIIIPGSYAGSLATPVPISKDVVYPESNSQGQLIDRTENKTSPGYPYIFFPATDYSTAIRIAVQAAWKISPGRFAMVHDTADKCLYCVDPLVAGKSYVEQLPGMLLGADLIIPQTTNPADEGLIKQAVLDYVQGEIDAKKADPSYEPVRWFWSGNSVFSSSLVGKAVAEAQKAINETNFTPPGQAWQLRVIANNWGIGETTPDICGEDCANIFYGLFPVPRYGDVQNAIGMTAMMTIHDDYRRKDGHQVDAYRDVRYVQGHVAARMWREAVERAVDAGHTHPSGEDLKEALESFDAQVLGGLTAGPVSFSSTDHRPQSNASVYKINETNNLVFVDSYSINLDKAWLGY